MGLPAFLRKVPSMGWSRRRGRVRLHCRSRGGCRRDGKPARCRRCGISQGRGRLCHVCGIVEAHTPSQPGGGDTASVGGNGEIPRAGRAGFPALVAGGGDCALFWIHGSNSGELASHAAQCQRLSQILVWPVVPLHMSKRGLYFKPPSHQSARSSFRVATTFSSSSSVA